MDTLHFQTLANDWLKDFSLALKNVESYSVEHPRGREYLERAFFSLMKVLEGRKEIALARSPGGLSLEQTVLERDPGMARQLAEELGARGVESIVFVDTTTPEEHLGLIRCLMAKPSRVEERGDFAQLLLDEGVSSVKVTIAAVGAGAGSDPLPLSDADLQQLIAAIAKGHPPRPTDPAPLLTDPLRSVTTLLSREPATMARCVVQHARRIARAGADTQSIADAVADTLERLAERAIAERQREREEILADLGRVVVFSEPELHPFLFAERPGARNQHKNLAAAIECLPPEGIADVVADHFRQGGGDHRRLTDMLARTSVWRESRGAALPVVQKKLRDLGAEPAQCRDLLDNLGWPDLPLPRRIELLQRGAHLWNADFGRVKDVLTRLFASDQAREATSLIQKYLDGLLSDELEVRRRVADNARYVLQLLEKVRKGQQAMLGRIADLFYTRLQDEQDADVVARLAGGLAFLADLRLRSGEYAAALDLMRKADQLGASSASVIRQRGERLTEALSRVGSDKLFSSLTEMLLSGDEQSSIEAAEILKRGGSRSATFLIERLAEEENRAHRARLVTLLKEMGKGTSGPFLARLDDPRWFLVRNVVGILGDIGDVAALPRLRGVIQHSDPRVRREAVRTVSRFAGDAGCAEMCEEMIIAALEDDDRGVQAMAIGALAATATPRRLPALLEVARRSGPHSGASLEVRQEAIAALGKLAAEEALPVLTDILTRRGLLGHQEPTELRAAAVKALACIKSAGARRLVTETAQKDPRQAVREAAAAALQAKGGAG